MAVFLTKWQISFSLLLQFHGLFSLVAMGHFERLRFVTKQDHNDVDGNFLKLPSLRVDRLGIDWRHFEGTDQSCWNSKSMICSSRRAYIVQIHAQDKRITTCGILSKANLHNLLESHYFPQNLTQHFSKWCLENNPASFNTNCFLCTVVGKKPGAFNLPFSNGFNWMSPNHHVKKWVDQNHHVTIQKWLFS